LVQGGEAFEVEFRLLNATSPPREIPNVFGQLWIDGKYLLKSTIPTTRSAAEAARVEWDIQIPVFPKEGVSIPTKLALRMPRPGDEILVGAQFVSKETERQEYFWGIVNENGVPKALAKKSPLELK
jgi:hypothetical protein